MKKIILLVLAGILIMPPNNSVHAMPVWNPEWIKRLSPSPEVAYKNVLFSLDNGAKEVKDWIFFEDNYKKLENDAYRYTVKEQAVSIVYLVTYHTDNGYNYSVNDNELCELITTAFPKSANFHEIFVSFDIDENGKKSNLYLVFAFSAMSYVVSPAGHQMGMPGPEPRSYELVFRENNIYGYGWRLDNNWYFEADDYPSHAPPIIGDIFQDGESAALVHLKRFFADFGEFDRLESTADLNGDGKIDTLDLIYLKRYLAGWDNYEL
jgi:hypothetical protein